jgi:hypothetical protein
LNKKSPEPPRPGTKAHHCGGSGGSQNHLKTTSLKKIHGSQNTPQVRKFREKLIEEAMNACRIPDDWKYDKRHPLFMARDVMRVLFEPLKPTKYLFVNKQLERFWFKRIRRRAHVDN